MRCLAAIACLLFSGLLAVSSAQAEASLSQAERAKIDALFKEQDKPTSPGCSVGVVRNGQPVFTRGYGMADLEQNVPIGPATVFDIASESKQFTAASIILLAQDGKLALSDDVRKHIPELPDFGAPITIDHLLRHTSGLRDYIPLLLLAGHSFKEVTTQEDGLAIIYRQRRLNFPSGSRHMYSNSGYILLAEIVRRVSGKPLGDFARERIFTPLGMHAARFVDDSTALIPKRALGYAPDGKGSFKRNEAFWEQVGDGALRLSLEDELRWLANFDQPRVGGKELITLLEERGTLTDGKSIDYARGLFVDEYRGLRRILHGGDVPGFHSMSMQFPQQRVAIAVLCNTDGIDTTTLTKGIADVVLASAFPSAESGSNVAASFTPGDPQRVVGSYFSSAEGTVYQVTADKDAVALKMLSMSLPLKPTGPTTYAVEGFPVEAKFDVEGAAPARALSLRIGGNLTIDATRFTQMTPTAQQLREYAGTYFSPEIDVTWPITIKDNQLQLESDAELLGPIRGPLDPAMADAFSGAVGLMQFRRDAAGRVSGFDLSFSRMHELHFELRKPEYVEAAATRTRAPAVETITNDISLSPGERARSVESFSGAITLGRGARVTGNVETEYGTLVLEPGSEVGGKLSNESGSIKVDAARVGRGIATTSGDIEIGPNSQIDGGILVRRRGVIGLSLGPLQLGVPAGRKTPPRVVIGPDAIVRGTLRFKREVQLLVSDRATIGPVEGATPVLFTGERPTL